MEGLYFYLTHFIVSLYRSILNSSLPFRTAVLTKKLENFFFLKRLEGLSFTEYIPFVIEFLRSKVAL